MNIRVTAVLSGLLLGCLGLAATASDLESVRDFNIGPQRLDTALIEFSKQANIQVIGATETLADIRTQGVRGQLTGREALKALLKNTSVSFNPVGTQSVQIVPARTKTNVSLLNQIHVAQAEPAESEPSGGQATKQRSASGTPTDDEIEVVGERVQPFTSSNIDLPRSVDDAQAYYIFDSQTLERSGALSLERFLHEQLPMSASNITQDQSVFIGGTGSSINLRGFGSAQTLVLINGRQAPMANLQLNSQNPQPDINGIPMSAVERIEVLPSSASGIYGGNAVGGVINVVLKRNYNGGQVKLNYQSPFDTHTPYRRADVTYGAGLEGGRTQILLSASYSDRDLLTFRDRRRPLENYFTTVYLNDQQNPAPMTFLGSTPNIRSSSGNLVLKNGNVPLGSPITYVPFGVTAATPAEIRDAGLHGNAGRYNSERPETVQSLGGLDGTIGTAPTVKSFMANVRRNFSEKVEMFGEFGYTGTSNFRNMNSTTSLSIPATAPQNPFVGAVTVTLPIIGDYPVRSNNLSRRATLGTLVRLAGYWQANLDYTWTQAKNSYRSTGFLSQADLTAAIAAGTINPFVDTKLSPIDLSHYNSVITYSGKSQKNLVTFRAVGPVWKLPAGAPQLAIGMDWRRDALSDGFHITQFANFPNRNILRLAPGKSQISRGAYAELRIPLVSPAQDVRYVRQLDLQLTGRAEDFKVHTATTFVQLEPPPVQPILRSTAKYDSFNPTVAMRWQPVKAMMLRGSFSRGFAPPLYNQLVDNPDGSTLNIRDPLRGNTIYSVLALAAGNSELQPETSRNQSLGMIFTPPAIEGLRVSVDWTIIKKRNNITTLSAQQMVDNEESYPHRITRDPPAPDDIYDVGPITVVDTSSVNLLKTWNEAVDLGVNYRLSTGRFGTFEVNGLATFTIHFRRQTTFNQPEVEAVNYSGTGPLRRRGHINLGWDYGAWTAGTTVRYIGSYRISTPPNPSSQVINRQGAPTVGSHTIVDVFTNYRFPTTPVGASQPSGWRNFMDGMEVHVGVRNLFDFMPRMDASNVSYFFSTWADIRGREYRLALTKNF